MLSSAPRQQQRQAEQQAEQRRIGEAASGVAESNTPPLKGKRPASLIALLVTMIPPSVPVLLVSRCSLPRLCPLRCAGSAVCVSDPPRRRRAP